jgi:hypothetical protein
MMAITREDDFMSRAEGEWCNSPERHFQFCDKFSFFTINNYLTGPSLHSVEDEPKHLIFIGVFRLFYQLRLSN